MSVPITPSDLEKGAPGPPEKQMVSRDGAPESDTDTTHSLNHQGKTSRASTYTSQHRLVTTPSTVADNDPGPPPDGGLKAWTQSFMAHFVLFNTWGLISAFGVFQSYYTSELGMEPSKASWIGSIQMLGHFALGMFSGRALDAGYFHWVVIPGVLISASGMFMTSLCSQYWHFFLAQGVLVGIGCGLQFTPTISVVTTYFTSNRSVAVAILGSGAATGGLVYPTIARHLIPKIGFPWTVRVIAFCMLAVGAVYCSFLRPRLPPRKTGPLLELSAFREPAYSIYLTAIFLIALGQYFTFYYLPSYAQEIIGASYSTSVHVLMVMNGAGVIGRMIPSFVADRYIGPYNALIPSCIMSSVTLYCWSAVHSTGGLYAFSAAYGFCVAGFQGMFPATLASLTEDLNKVGTRNGMGFAVVGLAMLVGPPLAGSLIQIRKGSHLHAQMFGGTVVLIGSGVLVLGRLWITGWKWKARV